MFRKLRNKLIAINLGVTSLVIVAVFSSIYIISTKSAKERPPFPNDAPFMNNEIQDFMEDIIREEKDSAAKQLLITLVGTGVAIEIVVTLISYYLAEQAIKPVRDAYDAQKVFITNASHEIKTPLAAISANLEAADIHGNKWIKNIERETAKLTLLNNDLLSLARTDLAGNRKTEIVDLKELALNVVTSFEPRMSDKKFSYLFTGNTRARINKEDFSQLLAILFDNAIKYSDNIIKLSIMDNKVMVTNDGATIEKKDLPHIFERFYQVDKSAEGVGLGLSIAKSLAENNHWKLEASSTKNSTSFILTF